MLQILQKQNTQITKHPRKQKAQIYKMSKVAKCPKLQNVQGYKISNVTIFFVLLYYFYIHLTWSITLLTRS